MRTKLLHGDCLDLLRKMPDCSVDAVVTDPPYGLRFMGCKWDCSVPGVEVWAECLRVLKPGGHLLAFAGTRTQHRMAVNIEDAGFEIRDMIAWVYGNGFPKNLDVSKAIDKRGGSIAGFEQFRDEVRAAMKRNGVGRTQLQAALGNYMLHHYLTAGSQPAVPNLRDYRIIRDTVQLGSEFDALFNDEAEREVVGQQKVHDLKENRPVAISAQGKDKTTHKIIDITAPATEAAKQWQGWGTALKPALEPITVARKPLTGTVAENVLKHGTGGINIDGCRVTGNGSELGRWPANLIHDGSEEVAGLLGSSARFFYCPKASKSDRDEGCGDSLNMRVDAHSQENGMDTCPRRNHHPTVKPTALMRYLCCLVTPSGGSILDPFMGSGSTGKAAVLEGFGFIGIECEAEYIEIARARIVSAASGRGS